ncbi:MAG TPA: hypothetical protein PKW11_15225, partial [Pseudomonadota bacterium]|nr:hypothetical protein [Pseudomonadota bacterium]
MAISAAMLVLSALTSLGLGASFPDGTIEGYGGGGAAVQRSGAAVVVVKSANVKAFQDVAESFRDRCRVGVIFTNLRHESADEAARVREAVAHARLLVAVGQPAAEALQGLRTRIVYAMVPSPPVGMVGTNSSVSPRDALATLRTLKPDIRHIGVIYTRQGLTKMVAARSAARALGLELHDQLVESSPDAIRAIYSLVWGRTDEAGNRTPKVDALWVGPDPLVVDMPLLQYLLTVQLTARVPVLAGTRQMVSHGVLMSIDWSPEAVGENLAIQVNQILDDPNHYELNRDHPV